MKRDLTQEWYEAALAKAGIGPIEFLGYRKIGVGGLTVSELNAGPRRRDRLAYLLAAQAKARERQQQEALESAKRVQ
jgi:hypothetical protein